MSSLVELAEFFISDNGVLAIGWLLYTWERFNNHRREKEQSIATKKLAVAINTLSIYVNAQGSNNGLVNK